VKITVLIDLDDTLLCTEETFFPTYIKSLAQKIGRVDPDLFAHEMKIITERMLAKDSPALTLEQTFNAYFYDAINIPRSEIIDILDDYYRNDYGQLQRLTRQLPESKTLIETAFSLGHQVAIATNPFFPRIATMQRLSWAGIPMENYPFSIVSTYEDFHFAKPNPSYFVELLAQLGWPSAPAVMIGNHMGQDILSAESLGFPTFFIQSTDGKRNITSHTLSSSGQLSEAIPWLKRISGEKFSNDFSTIPAMLNVMKSTPAALETLTKDIPFQKWSLQPDDNDYSLNELCCYFRDRDQEVYLPGIQRVITEAYTNFPNIETENWSNEMGYIHQNGQLALQDFIDSRIQIINLLSTLPDSTWQYQTNSAKYGMITFKKLIHKIVLHDQELIRQVKKVVDMLNHINKS